MDCHGSKITFTQRTYNQVCGNSTKTDYRFQLVGNITIKKPKPTTFIFLIQLHSVVISIMQNYKVLRDSISQGLIENRTGRMHMDYKGDSID